MAHRRGRKRKAGPRELSGRRSRRRAQAGPDFNLWGAYHRLLAGGYPAAAEALLRHLSKRQEAQENVLALARAATKNFHLSHLPGRAFAQDLFRWTDGRGEQHDGAELMRAADIYAALHRNVWGKLPADIEASLTDLYGPAAFNLLLEVGRVRAPTPPTSHFRNLVGETPAPPGEPDPAEYLKTRLRQADRYGASRAALYGAHGEFQRRGAVVENVVIWAIEPAFLRAGEVRTARVVDEQAAFVSGLLALAEHYNLFDRRGDRPADKRGDHPA